MPTPESGRLRLRVPRALFIAYAVQLVVVAYMWLVPVVDVENETHHYVVSRFSGATHFWPAIGLLPLVTGEPVRFTLTTSGAARPP